MPNDNIVSFRDPAPGGIVSLHGVPLAHEPVPHVVDMLADMLERAERGEIRSAAVAFVCKQAVGTSFMIEATPLDAHVLNSTVAVLHRRIMDSTLLESAEV